MGIRFLASVECAIDDETGFVYPASSDGSRPSPGRGSGYGVLITEVDPRWWEKLSPTDRQIMEDVAAKIDRAIQMSKWE